LGDAAIVHGATGTGVAGHQQLRWTRPEGQERKDLNERKPADFLSRFGADLRQAKQECAGGRKNKNEIDRRRKRKSQKHDTQFLS